MSTVTVVGAGNIGSHLLGHLARLPEIRRLIVVDPDRYEAKNLPGQDIESSEVGKPKAQAQARRLRRIRRDLEVEAVTARLEDVPPALLKADVLLTGLDSRAARQRVNELAWHLNMPWVDAGVNPAEMLARVTIYVPGPDAACMECSWSEHDYRLLEETYPCGTGAVQPGSTDAPSALGALAAAMQTTECRRILRGDLSGAASEVVLAAEGRRLYWTRLQRNPACRFDHRCWPTPCKVSASEFRLQDALELGALRVPGKYFARSLRCTVCGHRRQTLKLTGANGRLNARCPKCGGELRVWGFDLADRLTDELPASLRRRSLSRLGFRVGDIFQAGESFFEVAA